MNTKGIAALKGFDGTSEGMRKGTSKGNFKSDSKDRPSQVRFQRDFQVCFQNLTVNTKEISALKDVSKEHL